MNDPMEKLAAKGADLSAEKVVEYLRENPDFFDRFPQALYEMQAPAAHHGENIADFQHFMTERLREDRNELEGQLGELVSICRSNLHNQARIHAAVIALLNSVDLKEFVQCIGNDLPVVLDIDTARLVLENDGEHEAAFNDSGIRMLPEGGVDALLPDGPARLEAESQPLPEVFGAMAELVKSQAMLRLHIGEGYPAGILAFGSRDPVAFDAQQGTELISFLARVVECSLRRWLNSAS